MTRTHLSCWSSVAVIIFGLLLSYVSAHNNLRVAFEWREMDFKYSSPNERWSAIEKHEFKPNNVIPFGVELYGSRLFLTLPRWKDGVPATLAYIDLNDNSTKSPALIPFPSWEAHSLAEAEPELVSPFRGLIADRCGRLWVLDARISGVLERAKLYGPAQLLVYDLHNDNLLRRHIFPANHMKQGSFFSSLAIEDSDCENTFAYAGDLGAPGLVVYSWQKQESWRVQHNFFHPDPLSGNYSVDGIEFQWDDGLYSLTLSEADREGNSMLYFHPLSSTMEFVVNTKVLHDMEQATSGKIYREFKVIGSRSTNGQAGASFYDKKTGVLFYALPNLNAIDCWHTESTDYTPATRGRIYESPSELVFPSDVKVDRNDNLWVLSNRLPEFIYEELYPNSINFRILTAPVKEAVHHTPCDVNKNPIPAIINKVDEVLKAITSTSAPQTPKSAPSSAIMASSMSALLISMLAGLVCWLQRL